MKKRFSNSSLCTKISILFAILVSIIVIITSAVLYSYFQNTVKHLLTESVNSTMTFNTWQLKSLLDRIEDAEGLLHANEQLYYELGEKPLPICKMIISYTGSRQELIALRDEYTTNLNNFHSYFNTCFGDSGVPYYNVLFVDTQWPISRVMPKLKDYTQGNGFSSSREIAGSHWYQQAEALNGSRYWFVDETDSNYLCMAKALKYRFLSQDGTLTEHSLGVLLLRFDVSMINQSISLTELTEEAEVYLVDETDTVVFSTSGSGVSEPLREELISLEPGVVKEMTLEGRRCFVSRNELSLGLGQLTMVPIDNIQKSTTQSLRIVILTGILAMITGIIVIRILSVSLLNPLKRLTVHMEQGGNNEISCENAGSHEVASLYLAYNHMIHELNESMKQVIETTEKKNQAELHALQAQINPHFVYNTLNSVSCLAMLHGFEDIADILGNLTMLMRYNINQPDKLVPVADELYMIQQYESIQKCCYQECLTFEYEVDEAAKDIMIPKLIIQPLVENAIIHGADFKGNNAVLRLSIKLCGRELTIAVWDNGKAADVDKINRYLAAEPEKSEEKTHLGVRNVNQRLNKVFGEKAKLVYRHDPEGNTIAEILIQTE